MTSAYRGTVVVFGTRHGKHHQAAPAFDRYLGARVTAPPELDTDQFGTFTGERPRSLSPAAAARAKAHLAAHRTGRRQALASEASYGPLPGTGLLAMHNPTRRLLLTGLAERMARRLATPCPACSSPGFGRVDVLRGLPCAACGTPTDEPRAELHRCPACMHPLTRPHGAPTGTDPSWCPSCNP